MRRVVVVSGGWGNGLGPPTAYTHILTLMHTHMHMTNILICKGRFVSESNQADLPLTLALHSLTRHLIISRSLMLTATARGDSPFLVTEAVMREKVGILLGYS